MRQRWSVQEIVASLEAQAALHREREAFHAEQEAVHREQRSVHAAELAAVTQRLAEFQTVAAAALELAVRAPAAAAAPAEDFGPASNPKLTRMVKRVLADLGPREPFGPNGVLDEVNRRFGSSLRTRADLRQITDILRRMHRLGRLHRLRRGRPYHEARYAREAAQAGA